MPTDTSPEVVAVARRQETARGVSSSEKPVNFAVIVTKEAIKSMGLPGDHEINSITPSDAYHIIYSGLFTCNGLPCLSILLSNGCIFIYTLPGLKLVLQYQHEPLTEPKILYSYRVSGNGQCLYQLSPSQFQRLSVTSVDHLNIPLAYPELYVPIEGPVPLSKGMLNDLFIGLTSPAAINRDKVCKYIHHPSIHLSDYSSIHPSIHPFDYSFIHPSIHPFQLDMKQLVEVGDLLPEKMTHMKGSSKGQLVEVLLDQVVKVQPHLQVVEELPMPSLKLDKD
jgi:hypothetical protein